MRTRAEVPAAVPAISHRRPRDSCVGICQVVAVGFLLFLNCNNAPVQGLMTSTEGCVIGNMAAGESLRNADGTRRPIVSFMSAMNLNKRVRWMPSSSKGRHLGWCPGCARAPGSSSCLSANNEGTVSEPLVFAQDALDDAWRSQRRIDWDAQNGRSGTLGERLMTVLGRGRPSAMFVENRSFMDSTLDNVVRIYCTHNLPSWSMPWQRLKQESSTSTGFVIDGRRIITNAHSVEYSTMIQVRRRGSDRKYQAVQLAVGEECDLAVLTVEDEAFWEGTSPLQFGNLPELTDDVSVIGYPVGGDCISITAGVVSRVEMTTYAQAGQYLLSIQIDAAINPGNSGGPVVNDNGEVVGVAFQSLDADDVENIGYVVPVNVLEHFLEDVRRHDGRYLGFPRLGVSLQNLESPSLRGSLKMSPHQTGILVTGVEPTSPTMGVLHAGDVVMKVDEIKVANDGTIPFRFGERVALRYYFSQLFPGDKVKIEILRKERVMDVIVPLYIPKVLSPVHFNGRPPSYCVLGGLVFTVMSDPYLDNEWSENAENLVHLLSIAQHRKRQTVDEEIVILTQVLAHEVNLGYEGMNNLQLLKFNGEAVKSLGHLVRLADANKEPFMRFDLFPDKLIVLDASRVAVANDEICKENSIPSPRSAGLMKKGSEEAVPEGSGSDWHSRDEGNTPGPEPPRASSPEPFVRRPMALARRHCRRVSHSMGTRLAPRAWLRRQGTRLREAAAAALVPSTLAGRGRGVFDSRGERPSSVGGSITACGETRRPGASSSVVRREGSSPGVKGYRVKWRRSHLETHDEARTTGRA